MLSLIQGPRTQIDAFQTTIFSWLNDIPIKIKLFFKSWDGEIWYKMFNLTIFMFWSLQFLDIWKIHWVFCLIFASIKTKANQRSLNSSVFFKILKEPTLVLEKQTISHMKASILSFFEPEEQEDGIIMGALCPPPVKNLIPFLSEVLEAKQGWLVKEIMFYIKSPYLRISKSFGFWLECH